MMTTESEGLRQALRANSSSLLSYFERRVTHRADAADLLSETMLQAWRRVDALPGSALEQRMWLFAIAVNVLANHRRSTARRRALSDRLKAELEVRAESHDIAEGAAVRDAVLRLPANQRELVMLIHWDGFSAAEAADLLGVNPSTARGRYAAAQEALRLALGSAREHSPP